MASARYTICVWTKITQRLLLGKLLLIQIPTLNKSPLENAISCITVRVQIPMPSLLEGKSPASGEIFKHKIQLYKAIS